MMYGVIVFEFIDEPCGCGGKMQVECLFGIHDDLLEAHDQCWKLREKGISAIVEEHDGIWKIGETRKVPC